MKIDLAKLNDDELDTIIAEAGKLKEHRQAARKEAAIESIRKIAAETGIDLAELVSQPLRKRTNVGRPPVAPKYRNPSDATLTWSGRGKRPAWVVAHIDGGGTLESIAII